MTSPYESPGHSEAQRLEALRHYRLSVPGESFDDLASLAGNICETPIALITIFDEDGQKCIGVSGDRIDISGHRNAFCSHVISASDALVVPDARLDERFLDNSLVSETPAVRFYAGWPLVTPANLPIGTLCVMDYEPRRLSMAQHEGLRVLSRQIMTHFELARERRAREQHEARLKVVTEDANVGFAVIDTGHRFVYTNPTYIDIIGTPISDVSGMHVHDVLPGFYAEQVRPYLEQAFSGASAHCVVNGRGGSAGRYFDVNYQPMWVDDRVVQVLGVVTDITEYTVAQGDLRRRKAMLETEHELTPDGILAVDERGNVLLFNPQFCDMWGLSPHALSSRSGEELLEAIRGKLSNPDDFMAKVASLYSDHEAVSHDEVALVDGSVLERYSAPMRDAEGNYYGRIWYFRDVTDQRRAVEALRVAEERMRFAMESTGVGIWEMDYATGAVRWSEILEQLHGLQPGSFRGTLDDYVDLIFADDRTQLIEKIEQAAKDGGDFSVRYRVILPDRKVRWLAGTGRIFVDDSGDPRGAVGIAMDVTEQHLLEAQYHQAQKMEAIGRLAGGVAHDFNNLLTAILGYCDILLADLDDRHPANADIQEIQKAGRLAASLTGQLLSFSRKRMVTPTLFELNALVGEMHDMLKRLIGEDVKVVMNMNQFGSRVLADRGQIEQVVMNLVVNARDAMPQGGILTIDTDEVYLDAEYARTHLNVTPGQYVVLVVSDTGSGMTPDVQSRLFEPFFTTKEVGKGTGLGLSSVHGIVTGFGGSVGVYSEVGLGSSFRVYLPAHEQDGVIAEPAPAARPNEGTETVLVVEDADALRSLAERQLTRQGYTVVSAANAAQARELFEAHQPIDVILSDVVMPDASGPELVAQLIAQRPSLKVIFMSGFTRDVIADREVLESADGFLQKPFSAESLGQKIREVLDQESG